MDDQIKPTPAILDSSGKAIPPKVRCWDRWRGLTLKTKAIIVAVATFITGTTAVLTSIDSIKDSIGYGKVEISIPPIKVVLQNSSDVPIHVYERGEFMLWLPGGSAKHYTGKYSFANPDESNGVITIGPKRQIETHATISNVDAFYPYFKSGDYDLSLKIRSAENGLKITDEILPFTEEDLLRWHFTHDAGKSN